MFCRHQWVVVARKAVPGVVEQGGFHFKFGGGFMSDEVRQAILGYTVLEQRCTKCGKTVVTTCLGAVGKDA